MSKHIFISYSRGNLDLVQRVTTDLLNAGINVWIDQAGLKPGTPDWEQALRDAIHRAEAVLYMASPTARRSNFVRDELAIADMEGRKIYPVWVEGEQWMDCIPMGRGYVQFIDVRGSAYTAGVQQIVAALASKVVKLDTQETAATSEPTASVDTSQPPRNPYKGLRAFRAEDESDFFGRDTLIEELIAKLGNGTKPPRLLAVLGASGSGKSSVVMAGLLPRLRKGAIQGSEDWFYLDPIVLGTHPIESLTIALSHLMKDKSQKAIRDELLDRSKRGLYALTRELANKPVVLYIDQFEELFTLVNDEAERRQFVDLLTTAITETNGKLIVILTMRADFYDRPMQYAEFGKLVEAYHVAVTPMSLADLYDVVQKPAQLSGLTFDEGLVTEMVFAVREEVGALPLLQFTLDQLFEKRKGRTLTQKSYTAIGGVQGALAQHAEATYNSLLSQQHKILARALFLRLIEAGATEQDTTRRRTTTSELTLVDVEATRILQETTKAFIDARLLVSDKGGNERTVEVSHEALIREWKRLSEWLHEAREDLRLQKSLSADVAEWKRRKQPVDMLYRGIVLSETQAWAVRNTPSRDESLFLHESEKAEKQREAHEANLERQLRLRLQILVGGFGLVIILVVTVLLPLLNRAIAVRLEGEVDKRLSQTAVAFGQLMEQEEDLSLLAASFVANLPEVESIGSDRSIASTVLPALKTELVLQELSYYTPNHEPSGPALFYGGPQFLVANLISQRLVDGRDRLIWETVEAQAPKSGIVIAPQSSQIIGVAPVFNDGQLTGVVMAVFFLDDVYIHEIGAVLNVDAAIVRDNEIVASTIDSSSGYELILDEGFVTAADINSINIAYDDNISRRMLSHSLILDGVNQGHILVTRTMEDVIDVQKGVQNILLLFAAGIIVVSLGLIGGLIVLPNLRK